MTVFVNFEEILYLLGSYFVKRLNALVIIMELQFC